MGLQNNHFGSLIEQLNANLIVFIENEFDIINDSEYILSYLTMLNTKDLSLLSQDLMSYDSEMGEFIELLNNFIDGFNDSTQHSSINDNRNKYIESGKILAYLRSKWEEDDRFSDIVKLGEDLRTRLENLMDKNISHLFFKYGIGRANEDYKPFLREIFQLNTRRSIRFYNDILHGTQEKILSDVKTILDDDLSQFCLFIIDNKLNGQIDGEEYIEKEILPLRNNGYNVVSIIFTSDRKDIERNEITGYYKFHISKREYNPIEEVTKNLALSAYAHMFDKLRNIQKQSIDKAHDLALKRPVNILYLASMATIEGISVFEAINNWFELVKNEEVTRKLLDSQAHIPEYHYISGLCDFINHTYLDINRDGNSTLDEQRVFQLNTYEIFDYSVNEFHNPPMPGDIYEDRGNYYILVGQDCDFTVRKNDASRNTKTAELLRCSFIENSNFIDKVKVELNKIVFNYFQDISRENRILQVNLNKPLYADFIVLDTCTFNRDGSCKMHLDEGIDESILRILPNPWKEYSNKIRENVKDLVNIRDKVGSINISCLNDISAFDIFSIDGNNIVQYSLKRVCRLKGKFRDLLVNNYWNYRGRVGLNTTVITEFEKRKYTKIWINHIGDKEELREVEYEITFLRTHNRDRNQKMHKLPIEIDLSPLKESVHELRVIEGHLFSMERDEEIHSASKIKFVKKIDEEKNVLGIQIILPYFNSATKKYVAKENISILDLLDDTDRCIMQKLEKSELVFLDNQETTSIKDEKGKIQKFNITNLKRGISIPNINKCIILQDRSIITTESIISEHQTASSIE